MKRCLVCEYCFESETWDCPRCWHRPVLRDGVLCFIEDPPVASNGFKPEYFAKLARFEEDNFWFRARNALIQWALRDYFPNAKSFFEIGCGTGFVLAGIRENFPRVRLVGSGKQSLPRVSLLGAATEAAESAGGDKHSGLAAQCPRNRHSLVYASSG
jgi:hypothetical protein